MGKGTMTGRTLGSLALALCALAAFAGPAMGADPAPQALTFDVKVGPNNDIDCKITANLFTPPGASKNDPVPAVMGTNGFGGSKADFDTLGPSYAKRGIAFLAYSGLGFGNSGCKITLDDPDYDGKAGSQLLSFLGGTKAGTDANGKQVKIDYIASDGPGDPRVGMIGGSYGGQIQFAIAGIDKRLDVIVPQITWNDLAYSLGPNNTDFERGVTYRTPGVTKSDWPVLFTAIGFADGFQQAVQNNDPSHVGACPNFSDQACKGLVTSGSTGYPDPATLEFLRHASVTNYMSKIRIPVMLAQGQSDTLFDEQEAVATYKALRAQGTPVKMLWRSAGHSGGSISGESNAGNPEAAYESRMELEFLDYYLRGIGDPPALDFSFVRDWVTYQGDAAPSVGVTPSYPAATDQTVFLSGTDQLVPAKSGVTAGTANFAATPSPSGSGGSFTGTPAAPDAPGTFAAYSTAPLTADTDIVGIPQLKVKIDAPTFAQSQGADPATHLVLYAKLYDVDESGNNTLPRNLLSAVRVADVTKPVDIELPGIAHRFLKGHSIRLVVTTSNPTNRGNNASGPVSIVVDPAAPSTLTLPKLGSQVGATGAASDGRTLFQSPAGSPAPQQPGKGSKKRALTAASLSTNARCVKRRAVALRIVHHSGTNQAVSAVMTVNGRRVRTVTGKGLLSKIRLENMPKRGVFRVVVTVKTKGGKTLRSARTFRAC
jgi:ABC-2 type transport system ATP-binding protein